MTVYEETPSTRVTAPTTERATPQSGLPSANPSKPYWLQAPSPVLLGHRTTPDLPTEADVVVVGTGITGAFAVDKLVQKTGKNTTKAGSVLVLEAREACFGATGRNGGHCQPMVYYSSPPVAEFELATFRFLEAFVAQHDVPCDWRTVPGGGVHAYTDQAMFDTAVALVDALKTRRPDLAAQVAVVRPGAPAVPAGPSGTPVTLADLRLRGDVVGAIVQKHAASVWPYKLVAWVLERLVATCTPAQFNLQTNTPATQLTKTDGGWLVATPRGTVKARAVLLATNGYTSHLLPASLADLIVPVRGQVSALRPPGGPDTLLAGSYVVLGKDEGAGAGAERDEYLVQRPFGVGDENDNENAGHLIFGGGRERAANCGVGVWRDDEVEPAVAEFLATQLAPLLDVGSDAADALEADYAWTGVMGFSRDHHPWVGEVPGDALGLDTVESGLYLAAGFSGHGMPATALCGRSVARQIRRDLAWVAGPDAKAEAAEDHPLPSALALSADRLARARATCAPVAESDKRGFAYDLQDILADRLAS